MLGTRRASLLVVRPSWSARLEVPGCLALQVRGSLAQRERYGGLARAAHHRQRDLGAGRVAGEGGGEVAAAVDRLPIDRDDDIAGLQACLLRGAVAGGVVGESSDQYAALDREAVGGGDLRCDVLRLDADESLAGARYRTVLNELGCDVLDPIRRDRVADAGGRKLTGDHMSFQSTSHAGRLYCLR